MASGVATEVPSVSRNQILVTAGVMAGIAVAALAVRLIPAMRIVDSTERGAQPERPAAATGAGPRTAGSPEVPHPLGEP